jgi:molybdopterin/thiamine biosynthesis adenylyltransferase
LLPESAFIEVRTNRNNNRIMPIERDVLSTKSVGVVGLSVGQSFAMSVAMERGAGRIKIADFDTLELSNVNRIRTGVHQLGQPKWLITAREIAEIDPFLRVEVFPEGVNEDNIDAFLDGLDLICDACDDLATKAALRLNARARRLPVIMDTSDRGMLDVERYDQPEKIASGYLHGRIDEASMDMFLQCKAWTTEALHAFVDLDNVSERGRASIPLLGQELLAWPQVYTEVASGGAFAAQAARRILLDQFMPDVRLYINLDEQFAESFS